MTGRALATQAQPSSAPAHVLHKFTTKQASNTVKQRAPVARLQRQRLQARLQVPCKQTQRRARHPAVRRTQRQQRRGDAGRVAARRTLHKLGLAQRGRNLDEAAPGQLHRWHAARRQLERQHVRRCSLRQMFESNYRQNIHELSKNA